MPPSQAPRPLSKAAMQREELRQRLVSEGNVDLAAVLRRCALPVDILCQCCGAVRTVEQQCKKRWCPVCAPKISAARIARFQHAAERMQWPLAVTLTCRNDSTAHGVIRRLRKALTKLRERDIFTKLRPDGEPNVRGGIVSVEVTNTGSGWHVHAHLLLDCRWLAIAVREPARSSSRETFHRACKQAHAELSHEWAQCLRDNEAVVWVERAYGKALLETLKYAVKPTDLLECKEPIGPLLREMHRAQLCNGFGTLYGFTAQWKADVKAARPPSICADCRAENSQVPAAAVLRAVNALPHHDWTDSRKGAAEAWTEEQWHNARTLKSRRHAHNLRLVQSGAVIVIGDGIPY